jgi:hypothetical protein
MSTSAIPAAANAALSATNIHPHGHGHKHGMPLDALTDPSSSSAAQTPSGSTQNLFGTVLNTLEQVAGIQLTAAGQSPRPTAQTVPVQATVALPNAPTAGGSKINLTA